MERNENMKKAEHIAEADAIGRDSYGLMNFNELPDTASQQAQVEALEADRRWQEMHAIEVGQRIERLMTKITNAG